jgi:hypothetical protein
MRNIWTWVIGIVILLALIAIPFVLHYAPGYNFGFGAPRTVYSWHAPLQDGQRSWEPGPMWGGFDDQRAPLMGHRGWRAPLFGHHGFGYFPFFSPFMFVIGLLKLIIFGFLLYGAYWLGRHNARIVMSPSPAASEPGELSGQRPRKSARTQSR